MRIALVVERLARSGGGVEQAAWHVASALTAAGESVHVFCREAGALPRGVGVTTLAVSTAWQPWRVVAFSRRVRAAVEASPVGFDVVHALARTSHQDVYRAGAGRHADFMRSTYGRAGASLRRLSPRHALALRADRRIFGDPRQWIQCPSQRMCDEIVRGAGVDVSRTVVIPNGVDAGRFRPGGDDDSATVRRQHATPDETVWLLAGSGARRKGLDIAIRALAQARDERAVLWVAGRDRVTAWQREARGLGMADRVRFLGPRNDMADVYRAADGLLLPTRYDPFANASLEAAACGLPVVSTLRNGAMEVIADGGIAVTDPEDAAATAAALDRLSDPEARATMGARARKRAVLADWTSHAERLRELYARVVSERVASPHAVPA